MADIDFTDSAERTQFDPLHFGIGFLVVMAGIFVGAIALQFLFLR